MDIDQFSKLLSAFGDFGNLFSGIGDALSGSAAMSSGGGGKGGK